MHLSDEQREKLASIAARHGIDFVILFGSMVSGKTHAGSDVDLGVRFQAGAEASWRALGDLSVDLLEVFGDREVDLGLINLGDRR